MSNAKRATENESTEQTSLSRRADRLNETSEERQERERLFKLENAEAFASMNAWVEEHGLPLAKYRQF